MHDRRGRVGDQDAEYGSAHTVPDRQPCQRNERKLDDRPAVVRSDGIFENHDEERRTEPEHEIHARTLGGVLRFSLGVSRHASSCIAAGTTTIIALDSAASNREYCVRKSAAGYVWVSKKIAQETNPAKMGVAKTENSREIRYVAKRAQRERYFGLIDGQHHRPCENHFVNDRVADVRGYVRAQARRQEQRVRRHQDDRQRPPLPAQHQKQHDVERRTEEPGAKTGAGRVPRACHVGEEAHDHIDR